MTTDNIYGVVSLIFWSVMIIVTLTYVTLVMRADNDGEGGIMALIALIALIALVRRWGTRSGRTAVVLAALGVFGAALFSGDSMITPAISVLSAVEGLKVINPGLQGLPLLIAVTTFIIMTTWQRGSEIVTGRRETAEGPLQGFVDQLSRRRVLLRVPGTAAFLSRSSTTAPLALRANVKHNHVLHEHVVIVTIDTLSIARVADSERIEIDPLGHTHDGIIHVTARFGYMERPDVRRALHVLEPEKTEGLIAIDDASYFLSKIELTKGGEPTMSAWRRNLFIATSRLSTDGAEFFGLPQDRTLIEGARIEV